ISLDRLNHERRRIERDALEELVALVHDEVPAGLIVYGPTWRKGIAGILASRARERYGVPTFVLVHDPSTGMAVGSGRSVEGLSLITALRACSSVLHRFGGHSQAAGVTVAVENIPKFREMFETFLLEHPAEPIAAPQAESELDLGMANAVLFEQLRSMEPFGVGNPTPLFQVASAVVRPGNPGFVIVRQHRQEIKARSSEPVQGEGTALLALNGTSATLVRLD
ncbi:MAG TPA: DHHA1 domain-containing protein, partial [Edaphobacter sp.]